MLEKQITLHKTAALIIIINIGLLRLHFFIVLGRTVSKFLTRCTAWTTDRWCGSFATCWARKGDQPKTDFCDQEFHNCGVKQKRLVHAVKLVWWSNPNSRSTYWLVRKLSTMWSHAAPRQMDSAARSTRNRTLYSFKSRWSIPRYLLL